MTYRTIRNSSYIFSVVFHLALFGLFFLIKFTIDYAPQEVVEVGFGSFGPGNSSGSQGTEIQDTQQPSNPAASTKTNESANIVKEVELPKSANTQNENVIARAEKTDKNVKPESESSTSKSDANSSGASNAGKGNGQGIGDEGYGIDWGGKGTRRIYSYTLPSYPEGVTKEVDVKLRFTILPDGTVGKIFPLIKADTRLENAAINSLRQWRFEPLKRNQSQIEQNAVIIFPYRLQ